MKHYLAKYHFISSSNLFFHLGYYVQFSYFFVVVAPVKCLIKPF